MVTGPADPTSRASTTLRRCALAVALLHDVDLMPSADGVVLTGDPDRRDDGPLVTWREVREAFGDEDPESARARARVARWFRLRRTLATLPAESLPTRARVLGLARRHVLHPGQDWVCQAVPGGALDLGIGLVGTGGDDEVAQPAPPALLRAAGLDPGPWWPLAWSHLEQAGSRAARQVEDDCVLYPVGSTDVVTLLGSATFRSALVAGHGGTRTVAVPVRTRGWLDLRRIDPAFALAAATTVDPEESGFPRPLLVTCDEVAMPAD